MPILSIVFLYMDYGGYLQIYSQVALGYLSLGGAINISKNVSVYSLDVNGGSLNACAPIVALAAVGPSHNILSDITVTGASLTFGYPMALQPNVSWTDGNLNIVGIGAIVNFGPLTVVNDDVRIYIDLESTFLNYGSINIDSYDFENNI